MAGKGENGGGHDESRHPHDLLESQVSRSESNGGVGEGHRRRAKTWVVGTAVLLVCSVALWHHGTSSEGRPSVMLSGIDEGLSEGLLGGSSFSDVSSGDSSDGSGLSSLARGSAAGSAYASAVQYPIGIEQGRATGTFHAGVRRIRSAINSADRVVLLGQALLPQKKSDDESQDAAIDDDSGGGIKVRDESSA
eukprot:2891865-Rhodomonas_salina.3